MTYNPFSLEGKTVLVTGASSGIGQATAIECSRMGATVFITGRDEARLNSTFQQLEGTERCHRQITADLTRQEELENLVTQTDQIDGLVLCAGKGGLAPFSFSSPEKFHDIFSVNLFSTVEFLRLLYKKKKIKNEGSVVFIASISGVSNFAVGHTIYGASKAALNATMKYCANEFAAKKIRVNSITPGMVQTPLINNGTYTEEQRLEDISKYPLKRYGKPEDIANGVIYLLSGASSWVTGTTLVIDGGISI